MVETMSVIAFKKMDEKLLEFLEKKCVLFNRGYVNLSHEQIAGELGTSRVVISRILKQMEEEGKLKLAYRKIYLTDKNNAV